MGVLGPVRSDYVTAFRRSSEALCSPRVCKASGNVIIVIVVVIIIVITATMG